MIYGIASRGFYRLPNRAAPGSLSSTITGKTVMNTRKLICSLAAGVLCAVAAGHAGAQEGARTAPLRVFDATELTPDRYTVIKRIWVDNWRSAFGIKASDDSSAAIAALTAEATRAGADAITNLTCLHNQNTWVNRGYYCYGLAIKLK